MATLSSSEKELLKKFRALYKQSPTTLTYDMGEALLRGAPEKTRNAIKKQLTSAEKAWYGKTMNSWKDQYPQGWNGASATPAGPPVIEKNVKGTDTFDLSNSGGWKALTDSINGMLNPYISRQEKLLQNYYGDQDRMNRVGQETPYGSVRWEVDPATGRAVQVSTLDPKQQAILDQESAAAQEYLKNAQAGAAVSTEDGRRRAEQSVMDRWNAANEPRMAKELEAFKQGLANQGIPEGSEQYNLRMAQFAKSQQDARDQALAGAIGEGRAEQAHEVDMYQKTPTAVAGSLVGIGQNIREPNVYQPTNIDAVPIDVLNQASQWADRIVNDANTDAALDQQAEQWAKTYKLDKYKVKEELKLAYKQMLSQQAIAKIGANATLGAAGIAADASLKGIYAQIEANALENEKNREANAQYGAAGYGNGNSSTGDNFASGVGEGLGQGVGGSSSAGSGAKAAVKAFAPKTFTTPGGMTNSIAPQVTQQQTVKPAKNSAQAIANMSFGPRNSAFGPKRSMF